MDDHEPLHEFIKRVDDLVIARVIEEFEKELQ
jgi:hypothetical protein